MAQNSQGALQETTISRNCYPLSSQTQNGHNIAFPKSSGKTMAGQPDFKTSRPTFQWDILKSVRATSLTHQQFCFPRRRMTEYIQHVLLGLYYHPVIYTRFYRTELQWRGAIKEHNLSISRKLRTLINLSWGKSSFSVRCARVREPPSSWASLQSILSQPPRSLHHSLGRGQESELTWPPHTLTHIMCLSSPGHQREGAGVPQFCRWRMREHMSNPTLVICFFSWRNRCHWFIPFTCDLLLRRWKEGWSLCRLVHTSWTEINRF